MRMRFGPLALALALLLAACGGDDDDSEPAATQAAPAATATTETAATPAGVTKPGTTLKVGETAHVLLKPLSEGFDSKVRHELDATVVSIDEKTTADLKGVNLDADQKKARPYFVTVKIENTGKAFAGAEEDPDVRFDAVDDRGQEQSNNVIFIGGFPPCDDKRAPRRMAKGDGYESCLVFLIPGGGTLEEMRWSGSDEYIDKPIAWK